MVRKKVWPLLLAACSAIFASLLITTTDRNRSDVLLQADGVPNMKGGQQLPLVTSTATSATTTRVSGPAFAQYPVLPPAFPVAAPIFPSPQPAYVPPYAPGPTYVNVLPRPAVPRPAVPPVQYYNYPALNSASVSSAWGGEDSIGKWSDLFERVNDELTTDTMEIANLENQVTSRFPF